MNGEELFSNDKLKRMIVPLFLEQLLVMFVGIADTLIISYAGEAAVSGVSALLFVVTGNQEAGCLSGADSQCV